MAEIKKICRLFAAKTGEEHDRWLPLETHLRDTEAVMKRLVDRMPESLICAIKMKREPLKRVLLFLARIHDIGKCTVLFQNTITTFLPDVRERLEGAGMDLSGDGLLSPGRSPHAMAGACILTENQCPQCIAEIVAAHHGKTQYVDEDTAAEQFAEYQLNYFDEKNSEVWSDCWKELIQQALRVSGIDSMEELPQSLTVTTQMLLSGLLIAADWIASNPHYFPLISTEQTEPGESEPARAEYAWKLLALPDVWKPDTSVFDERCFQREFGFAPNIVQKTVIERINDTEIPGMMILEAQMGIGKTEAALSAAEIFAGKHHCGGLYFGLPTQATANGIFPRLESWARNQSQKSAHAIRLAHGMAEMNEEYQRLAEGTALTSGDEEKGGLIVHQWFCGRKQALLAEFVIGTVDQLLMAALKQKHVMLRHLGLSEKIVVIDECHAYDVYMSCYLDRALTWLGAYGVPTIILSATLPAKRREELVCAYLGRKPCPADEGWSVSRGYPLLTWTDGSQVHQETIPFADQQKTVLIHRADESTLTKAVQTALSTGGCAGVIVNTVKRAQNFARQLSSEIPNAEVFVFHAGFLYPDRAEKEKQLLTRLGKHSSPKERDRLIVVGTQVLEQSLDIDFDVMFTDLCPMDLLLQRIGRLHRHQRCRPPALAEAVCTVLSPADGTFEKGAEMIYGAWALWRTKELLPERITLPRDIPQLVQSAYSENNTPLEQTPELKKMRSTAFLKSQERRKNAKAYRLGTPDDGFFGDLLDAGIGGSNARGEAAVRDGDPSIEVLLLVHGEDDRVYFLPWQYGGAEILESHVPSERECCQIARQRIRLPHAFCTARRIDQTIADLEEQTQRYFAEWQHAPLLRGELILLLEPDLTARLAGCNLRYSRENGLEYKEDDR